MPRVRRRMLRVFRALGALLALQGPPALAAETGFTIGVGEPLPEAELPLLGGGGRHPLLGRGRASVFVFVRTGQDHSLDVLQRLTRLQAELAGKPVDFVAVVSGDEHPDDVQALASQVGLRMPVLVDDGDALYGLLGVKLHPVVGIADARHRLAAYEHFRKVNMEARVRAQVGLLLGELTPREVAEVMQPPAAPVEEPGAVRARWDARLARRLLAVGRVDQALALARQAVERAPDTAEPHAVLAAALAAQGDCAGAAREQRLAARAGKGPDLVALVPCTAP